MEPRRHPATAQRADRIWAEASVEHRIPFPRSTTPTACGTRPELFFPDGKSGYQEDLARVQRAKAICQVCPIANACLKWALVNPGLTTEGIWAATTPNERGRLRSKLIKRLGPALINESPVAGTRVRRERRVP
jgi:WhiB family redox-sensing transcriptional regulator